MTKEKLEELIKQEENPKLDFKRDYEEKKENTDYISDIVSIANGNMENIGETGYLIFGIQEKPKEIYGVEIDKELQDIKRHLAEKLNNHITPNIANIDVKDFYFDSKRVIVVIIPFQESILLLKKNVKQTRYKALDFLYRIGDGILVVSNAIDSKSVDEFKIKIDEYKENKKISEQLKLSGENFESKREIDEEYGSYKNQNGKVALFASLPIINNLKARLTIECEITIILENGTKIIVTVSEKEVLESLFSGYRVKPTKKNNKRRWLIFFDKKSNLYTIDISSTKINISLEIAKILSEMLDDLQEVYASKLNNIENKLNSKKFPFSEEYKNGFELCQIDLKLWNEIQKFILNHDHLHGDGQWDIFGYSLHSILIFFNKMSSDIMFHYKLENNIISPRAITTPSIIVIWDTLSLNHRGNDISVSVYEAYNWFVHKLIPQVKKEIYEDEEKKNSRWFNKKIKNNESLYIYDLKSDEEDNSLLNISERLGGFFFDIEVEISKVTLKDLYEGLILLLKKSKKLNYGYLSKKLLLLGNKNKKDLIKYIEEEINEIDKNEISLDILLSKHRIYRILGCYFIIIRDNFDSYPDTFIYDIEQKLKGIKEIYDVLKIVRRRLGYI